MTATANTTSGLRYQHNRKHKEPWQPGRRGSLCPPDIGLPQAQQLLKDSLSDGQHRYAVSNGRPFKGQDDGTGVWHGYPVGWVEVPESVRKSFRDSNLVKRHDIQRFWKRTRP